MIRQHASTSQHASNDVVYPHVSRAISRIAAAPCTWTKMVQVIDNAIDSYLSSSPFNGEVCFQEDQSHSVVVSCHRMLGLSPVPAATCLVEDESGGLCLEVLSAATATSLRSVRSTTPRALEAWEPALPVDRNVNLTAAPTRNQPFLQGPSLAVVRWLTPWPTEHASNGRHGLCSRRSSYQEVDDGACGRHGVLSVGTACVWGVM
jgi:hypothetical protein